MYVYNLQFHADMFSPELQTCSDYNLEGQRSDHKFSHRWKMEDREVTGDINTVFIGV